MSDYVEEGEMGKEKRKRVRGWPTDSLGPRPNTAKEELWHPCGPCCFPKVVAEYSMRVDAGGRECQKAGNGVERRHREVLVRGEEERECVCWKKRKSWVFGVY